MIYYIYYKVILKGRLMYALRDKETKSFAKLNPDAGPSSTSLVFADHCIEMNYYVNASLGFIASVLKQEEYTGDDYCPSIGHGVNPQKLEVVDLTTLKVVPLSVVFDGYDDDFVPPASADDNEFVFEDDIDESVTLTRRDN